MFFDVFLSIIMECFESPQCFGNMLERNGEWDAGPHFPSRMKIHIGFAICHGSISNLFLQNNNVEARISALFSPLLCRLNFPEPHEIYSKIQCYKNKVIIKQWPKKQTAIYTQLLKVHLCETSAYFDIIYIYLYIYINVFMPLYYSAWIWWILQAKTRVQPCNIMEEAGSCSCTGYIRG